MADDDPDPQSTPNLTRRALITGGSLIGAGLIVGGTLLGQQRQRSSAADATTDPTAKKPAMRTFVSTDLTTPVVTSWRTGTTAPGLIFVTQQVKGFNGLIMEEAGEPVWIEPTTSNITDLKVQQFEGRPVLTYWTGTSTGGHGAGVGTILDDTYTKVATVQAGNGLDADLHEFNLTAQGTALMTIYTVKKADLSTIGGAADGYIYDCHVQEVDVRTGRVLLDWSAYDHVPIKDTYLTLKQDPGHDGTTAARAFDAYHLNAVEEDGDALLVSSRHTHTIYSIDRTTGTVRWRFGGKHSDIAVPDDAAFAWQHDVRRHPDGTITLFDNHLYSGTNGESRGLRFTLDESADIATVEQVFTYDGHLGTAMGSVQVLPNGNVLVGWGTDPAATEFTYAGAAIYEATLGGISYRASRHPWVAHPATVPAIAARAESGGVRVFASWNGATEVSRWRILAADAGATPQAVATVPRTGFETAHLVPAAKVVAVQALDASGAVLATSRTVTL